MMTMKTLLATSEDWISSGSGYSFLKPPGYGFGGEVVDANKLINGFSDPELDESEWSPATLLQVPIHLVTPQVVETNRAYETIDAVSIKQVEEGTYLVDMGKNFTGRVTIQFPALPNAQEVSMRYSDHLTEGNNELFNMQIDRYMH